jgi:hypothetical protein
VGDMAQVEEYLPNKLEVLSLNPSTAINKIKLKCKPRSQRQS